MPDDVETFLLTSRQEPEAIVEQHREIGTTAIQIVDELPPGGLSSLRGMLPEVRLIQVIHVRAAGRRSGAG